MYKLLVVEDEVKIREGIREMIDWATEDIIVCGVAENGVTALAMLTELQPDLVLTDIRMPQLDGLGFIEELRKLRQDIELVILSGYSDFTYAQKALQFGVSDFLIKPCHPEEVKASIIRAKHKLEGRRTTSIQQQQLQHHLHAHARQIRQDLLRKWLHEAPSMGEDRYAMRADLHLGVQARDLKVVVLQYDSASIHSLHYSERELGLIKYSASNIAEERLRASFEEVELALSNAQELVFIINWPAQLRDETLQRKFSDLQTNVQAYLKITVSIGIGSTTDLERLHESYLTAKAALTGKFIHGNGKVFWHGAAEGKAEQLLQQTIQCAIQRVETTLLEGVRACSDSAAVDEIEQWLALVSTQALTPQAIVVQCYSLVGTLVHRVYAHKGSDDEKAKLLVEMADAISSQETVEELFGWMARVIQQFIEIMNEQRPIHKTIKHVLKLIHTKYAENLTLKAIAEEAFISTSHLSELFKQEMGMNYLDYLHHYRIEKAKALLKDRESKIHTVARQVGYCDEAHFTKNFKKWSGVLPSAYQKNQSG